MKSKQRPKVKWIKKGSKFTFCAYTPIKEVFEQLIAEALEKSESVRMFATI